MKKDALIIGGGVAGLWCASELSRLGFGSAVVERNPYPGGQVASYCCKATDECRRCGACLLEEVIDWAASSERIDVLLRSTLTDLKPAGNRFQAAIAQSPSRIHPYRCTQCDKCLVVCPAAGALVRSPLDGTLNIGEEACLFFKDGSCRLCAETCPDSAVDLDTAEQLVELEAAAVVVATGFKPFDPTAKPRFGYGRTPGVITALELDAMLRADTFFPGDEEKELRSVAFIQCVGSRDPKLGLNYCSRVCCGYALRMARLLKYRFPAIVPSMFYMDIQTFDRDFERRLDEARREVRLVRAIPSEVRTGSDRRPEMIYHGPDDTRITESYDLVVLSVGMSPDSHGNRVARFLGLASNEDGFFGTEGEGVSTTSPGVFVAGAVQGPKSIDRTVTHAIRTAGTVAEYLRRQQEGDNQ